MDGDLRTWNKLVGADKNRIIKAAEGSKDLKKTYNPYDFEGASRNISEVLEDMEE